jgi:hypothetical protein
MLKPSSEIVKGRHLSEVKPFFLETAVFRNYDALSFSVTIND